MICDALDRDDLIIDGLVANGLGDARWSMAHIVTLSMVFGAQPEHTKNKRVWAKPKHMKNKRGVGVTWYGRVVQKY